MSGHVLDTVFHVTVKHVISPSSLPDFSQSLIAPAVIPRIGNGDWAFDRCFFERTDEELKIGKKTMTLVSDGLSSIPSLSYSCDIVQSSPSHRPHPHLSPACNLVTPGLQISGHTI